MCFYLGRKVCTFMWAERYVFLSGQKSMYFYLGRKVCTFIWAEKYALLRYMGRKVCTFMWSERYILLYGQKSIYFYVGRKVYTFMDISVKTWPYYWYCIGKFIFLKTCLLWTGMPLSIYCKVNHRLIVRYWTCALLFVGLRCMLSFHCIGQFTIRWLQSGNKGVAWRGLLLLQEHMNYCRHQKFKPILMLEKKITCKQNRMIRHHFLVYMLTDVCSNVLGQISAYELYSRMGY